MRAIDQACEQCAAGLAGAAPDLVVVFISAHHLEAAKAIAYVARRRLSPRCLIGVSAEAVAGGEAELEGAAGVSMLAASMPGVGLHPFRLDRLPRTEAGSDENAALAKATGMAGDTYRGTILLADPFSVAMNALLPALSAARPRRAGEEQGPRGPIVGGMASASAKAGGNALILDDAVLNEGAVGVSLSGAVRMDALVSQGCRPFGPTYVVTKAKNQMIRELSGKPALKALHDAIETLDERSKRQLQRGLFVGRAVNEYKERFGRGDFLIRAVVGADQASEMIAVADLVRVGQTMQFHLRDAATASEDLALLLDREQLYDPPVGALLFTCNGRGTKLFDRPHHDAAAIARAFAPDESGEEKAKAGRLIETEGVVGSRPGTVPMAGFFAAGEIGPIGDEAFLHGHTASVALFRSLN